jgi:hypothetical protein
MLGDLGVIYAWGRERICLSGNHSYGRAGFEGISEPTADFARVDFIDVIDTQEQLIGQPLVKACSVSRIEACSGNRLPHIVHVHSSWSPPL